MRIVKYRQTHHDGSMVKNSLPVGWITEYTFADLQPENSLEDWLELPEDQFNELLNVTNTQEFMDQFIDSERVKNIQNHLVFKEELRSYVQKKEQEKSDLEKEFELFKQWRNNGV